ncbi:MAG: CHASE2 domain-containing protein [Fimbriimonas sp.]
MTTWHPKLVVIEFREDDPTKALSWSDYATLLYSLKQAGASTVAFDLSWEPRPGQEVLRNAIVDVAPMNVVVGVAPTEEDSREDENEPDGWRIAFERSGIVTKPTPNAEVASILPIEHPEVQDEIVAAVALRKDWTTGRNISYIGVTPVLMDLGLDIQQARIVGDQLVVGRNRWTVGASHEIPVIPIGKDSRWPTYEYRDALRQMKSEPALFRGKIVFVGDASRSGKDILKVPGGKAEAGVQIVAMIANTALLRRGHLLPYPLLMILAWSTVLSSLAVLSLWHRWPSPAVIGPVVSGAIAIFAPRYISAQTGLLIETVAPTFSIAMVSICVVSLQALNILPTDLRVAGRMQEATVLFVDLRDSTRLTQRLGGENFQALNSKVNRILMQTISGFKGDVERTLGDGALVIFWPGKRSHVKRALQCSQAILSAIDSASFTGIPEDLTIGVTVGFETGVISGGYVREGRGKVWSSTGTTVNLAARLQGSCGSLGIPLAIGPSAAAKLVNVADLRSAGRFAPKGLAEEVEVFTV